MPVLAVTQCCTTQCTSSIASITSCRCLLGVLSIVAAEEATEERFEAGQAGGDDTDVELDDGPDGDIARVPKPVAEFTVVGDITDFDDSSDTGKDTEAENGKECHTSAEVNVEIP